MESNLQQNFNVGFTNMKSDVLVHLTQWQYWWWFWFSLLWAFYYLMVLKMVRFRSLKFRPRIATTLRPHGKWGDLIICIIPVSWCANIITNSNFILRMIEWQSESGLLTVRIRGKQWYWVYKFELKTFTDVFTVPKNIGHNKWQISTPNDLQVADDYLHILQLRSQNRWVKSYWEELSKEMSKSKNFHMISPKDFIIEDLVTLHAQIVNGELITPYSVMSSIQKDDTTLVFNRSILSMELQSLLNWIGLYEDKNFFVGAPAFKYAEFVQSEDDEAFVAPSSVDQASDSNAGEFDNFNLESDSLAEEDDSSVQDLQSDSSVQDLQSDSSVQDLQSDSTTTATNNSFDYSQYGHTFKPLEFRLPEELKAGLLEIIKKNPTSQSDFNYLAYNLSKRGYLPSRFLDVDSFIKHFENLSKGLFTTNEFVTFDFDNLYDLRDYLHVVTSFDWNSDVSNSKLMFELNNFFLENVFPKLKNSEEVLFKYKCLSENIFTLQAYNERVEFLKEFENLNSSEFSEYLLDFPISDIDGFTDELLGDRSWLSNSSAYSDFLVRLCNKKLNSDGSTLLDSFEEKFNFLLTNDDVFETRSDEVDNINSFFTGDFSNIQVFSSVSDVPENYTYSDFNEFDRNSRKSQGTVSPVRLIKYPVSNKTNFDFASDVIELFRFRFNENEASVEHRLTPNSAFLIIRQKRYKRRKVILPRTIFMKDGDGNFTKKVKSSNYTFLSQNSIILENDFNATKRYKFFKKNKVRDELTNLVLSKRILRTRRTLVLPAHLNITAITNSFDVIHSWFIPGLGLKMDAIPGRATHHTFYIDNVGFYYGQCAEICGRYHHHMPVRICALPFEHFLLWWQSFGLPKLLFTRNFRRYSYSYGSRKYAW